MDKRRILERCARHKYPTEPLKTVNGSLFLFDINGIEYTLCVALSSRQYADTTKLKSMIGGFSVWDNTIDPNEMWLSLFPEVFEIIGSRFVDYHGDELCDAITALHGIFPDYPHKQRYLNILLVPTNKIVRAAYDKDPNRQPRHIHALEQLNRVMPPADIIKFQPHLVELQKKFDNINNYLKTESTEHNVFPFTGNGYTLDLWAEMYGLTEFLLQNATIEEIKVIKIIDIQNWNKRKIL